MVFALVPFFTTMKAYIMPANALRGGTPAIVSVSQRMVRP